MRSIRGWRPAPAGASPLHERVMSAALLEVRSLSTWIDSSRGPVRAVDGVSLDVEAGTTFALLGESGCGKSMTALSLMRLLPEPARIVSGSVRFEGVDLMALTEARMRQVRGGAMAMIFQEPATSLNPVLTVGTQIGEVLERHAGLSGAAAHQRAAELLEAVGIPDPVRRLREYPFRLSGGMKQRVMIAIALAGEPRLLLADEPTTALDVTIQAQVLELLDSVQRARATAILLITHDLGVVARIAHRVGVMYAGELVEIAPREAFFGHARHPYSEKLFAALPGAGRRGASLATIPGSVPALSQLFHGCRFADRCHRAFEPCKLRLPEWHEVGEGHRVRCHLYAGGMVPKRATAATAGMTGPPEPDGRIRELLMVEDLAVHFPIRRGIFKRIAGHVKAVDGVSLALQPGRTVALVGESGCGKTTVGKAILRLIPATRGNILFDGAPVREIRGAALAAMRSGMQMIFQDPYASLDPRMRVGDIIAEGMRATGARTAASTGGVSGRIADLLRQVGLEGEMQSRYPHEFSGGQRQRIAIARALAVRPRVLICDEPTSALDVSVQAQILNLLKALQSEFGLAYLFITHNISVVEYLAHEVAVMYLGRIVERGTVDEVLNSPAHPYTQALLSAVPRLDREGAREVIVLRGELPSPANPPPGCHFHPRCPRAVELCQRSYPPAVWRSATHAASCHLHGGGGSSPDGARDAIVTGA
jgi:peptide/nickel transport system ATP-binding protein